MMSDIEKAKKEFVKDFSGIPGLEDELDAFVRALPVNYVRQDGKIQVCDNHDVWEDNQTCLGYFAGMCCCSLDEPCSYGNENKKWVKDGEEAEKHSQECRKAYQEENSNWKQV
jgi:hypothetical protein